MVLTDEELITYLANLIFLAQVETGLSPKETAAIEEIRAAIGAKKGTLNAALKAVQSGQYVPVKVRAFAAQVSNIADMLYVCFVDGDLSEREKSIVTQFCRKVGLTQEQEDMMVKEAITRVEQVRLSVVCPSCKAEVSSESQFCPKCGSPIAKSDREGAAFAFQIPAAGYAIEFCESTAAGFPAALDFARTAPSFSTCLRSKKIWYLAAWPDKAFEDASRLAQFLGGIRNRKCYHNGAEIPWDELFGFTWCASERSKAYRPTEYCFGKDENRLNPWGCKQARMEWTEWARWFSYGHFEPRSVIKGTAIWVFDKPRIRHEVMTNLHRFRYCPYLRQGLVDAILRALPDEVEVKASGPWKYGQAYEEGPGSIKVVEVEGSGGYESKREYFADGVRPRGSGQLEEVLRKAFTEAGVADIRPAELTR